MKETSVIIYDTDIYYKNQENNLWCFDFHIGNTIRLYLDIETYFLILLEAGIIITGKVFSII